MKISHIKDKQEVILTQNERASFRLPADKVDVTISRIARSTCTV